MCITRSVSSAAGFTTLEKSESRASRVKLRGRNEYCIRSSLLKLENKKGQICVIMLTQSQTS